MIVYPVLTEHANAPACAVFLALADRALVTAYPFVIGERHPRDLMWFARHFGDRPVVLDSGLYTLMRDVSKGNRPDEAYCRRFFGNLLTIMQNVPQHWVLVELDLHILDGMQDTVDDFRRVYVERGLVDRVVHVWHLVDGVAKLPGYWDTYKRVSCSYRELSFFGDDPREFSRNLRASSNHWRGCHTHMLGTANLDLVESFNDSFSCDATSWNAIVLYGETKVRGKWVRWDAKAKRLVTNVPGLIDRVEHTMPEMIDWYKRHPDYKTGQHVRRNYVRQLAAGFLLYTGVAESARRAGRGYKAGIQDPIVYWD